MRASLVNNITHVATVISSMFTSAYAAAARFYRAVEFFTTKTTAAESVGMDVADRGC